MINNYTYQTLPFYDSIEKQNFKQEWIHNDLCSSYLFCPHNRLLPFQLSRRTKPNAVANLWLYCFNQTLHDDILHEIPAADLVITTAGSTDYITYFGNKDLTDDLPEGLYYLVIYDGTQYWYSEVFKVVCFDFGVTNYATPLDGNIPHRADTLSDDHIKISANDVLIFKSS